MLQVYYHYNLSSSDTDQGQVALLGYRLGYTSYYRSWIVEHSAATAKDDAVPDDNIIDEQ